MNDQIVSMVEEFGKLDATTVSAETAIASRIISKLFGYKIGLGLKYEQDVKILENAIQAYAKLLQDAGVKI